MLGVGLVAATVLLTAELLVGIGLRGMSASEIFTGRDPVSGYMYFALVALFAVMPWLFGRGLSGTKDAEPSAT